MTIFSGVISERPSQPPTPPADHSHDLAISEALDFLNVDFDLEKVVAAPAKPVAGLGTPPKSSPTALSTIPSSREKKVGFQKFTTEHHGPSPKKTSTELRPLPQTRAAKPLKSILKSNVCNTPSSEEEQNNSTGYFSPDRPLNVPKMLESVLQSLSSSDLLTRLDGYQILNSALKAHSNFPSKDALRERIPALQTYILRDVKPPADDTRNTNLSTQALKLVMALLQVERLSTSVTDDFRSSIFDLALDAMAKQVANKAITNHFLYILASPEFRSRSLTPAKADLLLSKLDGITDRISGNSVVAARLIIYLRLIDQIPTVMLPKVRTWVEHIFHGCVSSNEDICRRAIECGTRAGLDFGNHYSAQKAVVDIFATQSPDGTSYGQFFVTKMSEMTSHQTRSSLVPRIWSLIILFFRSTKRPLTAWQMHRPLLEVIQKCLNASDIHTRYQAIIAWNRLVYVVGLDKVTLSPVDHVVRMLKVPFVSAFDCTRQNGNRNSFESARQNGVRNISEGRKTSYIGYTNLLYYAFQPTQTWDRLDFFWNAYAEQILSHMLRNGSKDGNFANRALKALFMDGGKAWNPERANVAPEIKVEELPRIDPNWLRTRLSKILGAFESYFGASLCVANAGSDVYETPWRHLMLSIAEAGSQEVRASLETREALAHLMNFFRKVWKSASRWAKDTPSKTFIHHFGDMVNVTIQAFGAVVFLDDNLAIDQAETVQPAPTPSNRSSKHHAQLQSPFNFLLQVICAQHDTLIDEEAIGHVIESLLETMLQHQTTAAAKLSTLRQCLSTLKSDSEESRKSQFVSNVSETILHSAIAILKGEQEDGRQSHHGQLTRHTTALLVDYLKCQHDTDLSITWFDAMETARQYFSSLGGDNLVHLGLVDVMIGALLGDFETIEPTVFVQAATAMISRASWITSNQQVEKAKKVLGVNTFEHTKRPGSADKNERAMEFINVALKLAYENTDTCDSKAISCFESAIAHVQKCPAILKPAPFQHFDTGFGLMIRDPENQFAQDTPAANGMREQILNGWQALSSHFSTSRGDHKMLEILSPMFIAAFQSRYIPVVNDAIGQWNNLIGDLTESTCPTPLIPYLLEIAQHVRLDLPISIDPPTGEIAQPSHEAPVLPVFAGGSYQLGDGEEIMTEFPQRLRELHNERTPSRRSASAGPQITGSRTQTPKTKAMPPPRLRHDNSQIEFVSVENLPIEIIADQSQGLTEHQKEVRERQQQDAAGLLGQFSSSPARSSSSKNLIVDRVRERMRSESIGARLGTPEVLEEAGILDEPLGSSPSAQSVQRAQSRSSRHGSSPELRIRQPVFIDQAAHDEVMDIPSSPPEQPDDYFENPESVFFTAAPLMGSIGNDEVVEIDATVFSPTGQRNMDKVPNSSAEDVETTREPAQTTEDCAGVVNETTIADITTASDIGLVGLNHSQPDVDESLVEDSFVSQVNEPASQLTADGSISTSQSTRRTRKRKSNIIPAENKTNKRQRVAPVLEMFVGRPEPDDGLLDCIVVAIEPEEETEEFSETAEPQTSISQPHTTSKKRKSKNPRNAASQPTASRGVKRKSSRLSDTADTAGDDDDASVIVEPPTRKTRRQTQSQDAKQAIEAEQQLIQATPVKTATITDEGPHGDSNEIECSAESQLRREAEEAARLEARPIASPSSLLGRLRNILADVKEMGRKFVLGSQDQMELSGVLFELGHEVHAARQRSKE